jgi:hypothetical protein
MRNEIPWKVVAPVLAVLVVALIVIFVRATVTPTVSEKDIKAPAPPGGFPSGKAPAPSPN